MKNHMHILQYNQKNAHITAKGPKSSKEPCIYQQKRKITSLGGVISEASLAPQRRSKLYELIHAYVSSQSETGKSLEEPWTCRPPTRPPARARTHPSTRPLAHPPDHRLTHPPTTHPNPRPTPLWNPSLWNPSLWRCGTPACGSWPVELVEP